MCLTEYVYDLTARSHTVFSLYLSTIGKMNFQTDRSILLPVEFSRVLSNFRQLILLITTWKGEATWKKTGVICVLFHCCENRDTTIHKDASGKTITAQLHVESTL